jgi:P4 family phage/plasmid primase-like protien
MKNSINGQSLTSTTIHISFGKNKFDNNPQQIELSDFRSFVKFCWDNRSDSKHKTYICSPMDLGTHDSPAKYSGENHWRLKSHALPRRFLALDLDSFSQPTVWGWLRQWLRDQHLNCFWYTTSSSTLVAPRARVLIELSRAINVTEGKVVGIAFQARIEAAMQAALGDGAIIQFDQSVYELAQPIYLPVENTWTQKHRQDDDITELYDEDLLNVDALLAHAPAVETSKAQTKTPEAAAEIWQKKTIEEQQQAIARFKENLRLWAKAGSEGSFQSTDAIAAHTELVGIGAQWHWCWRFDDDSRDALIAELTKDDVSTLERIKWLGIVALSARFAPAGSADAQTIKASVKAWSEHHECWDLDWDHSEAEFESVWSEGEYGTHGENYPIKRLMYLRGQDAAMPKLVLANGEVIDILSKTSSGFALTAFDFSTISQGLGNLFGTTTNNDMANQQPQGELFAEHALPQFEIVDGDGANLQQAGSRGDVLYGRIFASQTRDKFVYVQTDGVWLHWSDAQGRWALCSRNEHVEAAKKVAVALLLNAAREFKGDTKRITEIAKLQDVYKLNSMLTMAQSEPGMVISSMVVFDADPYLLGMRNGVIDLKTGKLIEARPSHLISKQCSVEFDPSATCPLWQKFIAECCLGDLDLLDYLQRSMGYTLTGDVGEELMHFWYGGGRNGKSVAINIFSRIMGDYVKVASPDLLVSIGKSKETMYASLRGARLVMLNETKIGQRFDDSAVKQLVGREQIEARELYGKSFSYMPTFKLFLRGNHKPIIHDTSDGMWRKLRLVPFNNSVPEDMADPHLEEKLWQERSGIFNWMLEGVMKYRIKRLTPPKAVIDAGKDYRQDSDLLNEWLEDKTIRGDYTSTGDAYRNYKWWAEEQGLRPMSNKMLTMRLQDHGIKSDKVNRVRCYIGIKLVNEPLVVMTG